MSTPLRISIFCPDKIGLISAITGKLFDLGANRGDTNFAFDMPISHAASANITHRILVEGGDNPGLVARLTEVFVEFKANIVRLNTEVTLGEPSDQYRIDIHVYIPNPSVQACLATIENTASALQMRCFVESLNS